MFLKNFITRIVKYANIEPTVVRKIITESTLFHVVVEVIAQQK